MDVEPDSVLEGKMVLEDALVIFDVVNHGVVELIVMVDALGLLAVVGL